MRGAALVLPVAAAACTSDLFHSTEWESRCDRDPAACAPSASTGAGAGGGGGGTGGASATTGTGGQGGTCTPGASGACYSGPAGTLDVGACKGGTRTCSPDGTWGPCSGEVTPSAEDCSTPADEDCDGQGLGGCVLGSCADLPAGSPSGVYPVDPDGGGAIDVYCDTVTAGGGWALVLSSVGSNAGVTTAFWQLAYADRLSTRGTPSPDENFYAGRLYLAGLEWRDELVDLAATRVDVFQATATSFDAATMTFGGPVLVSGLSEAYGCHFAAGWSSLDHDGDTQDPSNCASDYANVAQHYCACWNMNLGADADADHLDGGWGPHVGSGVAAGLGIATDGTSYTRVMRISRWARW